MLGDAAVSVRRTAIRALEGHEEPRVTLALVSCINDQGVRYAAASALKGRNEPMVTSALLNMLTAPDMTSEYSTPGKA